MRHELSKFRYGRAHNASFAKVQLQETGRGPSPHAPRARHSGWASGYTHTALNRSNIPPEAEAAGAVADSAAPADTHESVADIWSHVQRLTLCKHGRSIRKQSNSCERLRE